MTFDLPDVAFHVGEMVFLAGVVWGTLKVELRNMHESIAENRDAVLRAHDRIDEIYRDRIQPLGNHYRASRDT